jgi:hypothetical protein
VVEAADLGEFVGDRPGGDVAQRTPGADGAELLGIPHQQQLRPRGLGPAVDRDQVGGRGGPGLVDDHQVPCAQPQRLIAC